MEFMGRSKLYGVQKRLDKFELFALRYLFDVEESSDEVTQGFYYQVQSRSITAAGFFSIIKCKKPSRHIKSRQEVSKTLVHPMLKRGGMLICWVEQDLTLCLEGVAEKKNWPSELLPRSLQVKNNI